MPSPTLLKSNNQPKRTKINYFYLVRQFPLLTFFHYLTGFLSAYGKAKILTQVTTYVNKDKSINIGQVKGSFWEIIGRFLVFYGIVVFLHIAMEIWLVEVYGSHLRQRLAQKYLEANFSSAQKARFILTNYENESINVGTKAAQIFNRCFYAAVSIFFIFWELRKGENAQFIPWLLVALLILTLIGLLLYQWAYRPRLRRTQDVQQENSHFEELKTNLEYIKISGTEKKEIKKNDNLITKNLRKMPLLVVSKSAFATIPNYLLIKILPLPFLLVANAGGIINLFVLYTQLDTLFDGWKKFFEELWAKGGYDGYCSSLKQLNEGFAILEKDTSPVPKIYSLPASKNSAITLQKVNFAYPETNRQVLDNFSFNFQRGEKYVIIGPNGIGKSTLFKLMVKLYQPQRGTIKLDDIKLEEIDNSILREKVVYLPNNPSFFNTSLGNNIVYPETYQAPVHEKRLETIVKNLGIKEFFDQFPQRWETTIAEKGQNLSEGQKQIISLMRALARDYQIYLLDEFLSNVNVELKRKVLKAFFIHLKNKMVILISHDPETLAYADQIYQFSPTGLIKKTNPKI